MPCVNPRGFSGGKGEERTKRKKENDVRAVRLKAGFDGGRRKKGGREEGMK